MTQKAKGSSDSQTSFCFSSWALFTFLKMSVSGSCVNYKKKKKVSIGSQQSYFYQGLGFRGPHLIKINALKQEDFHIVKHKLFRSRETFFFIHAKMLLQYSKWSLNKIKIKRIVCFCLLTSHLHLTTIIASHRTCSLHTEAGKHYVLCWRATHP